MIMAGLSTVTAAILVGGMGTRLRHAVRDLPKVMAPVSGRPFLMYLLDQLSAAGVRNVVLCTGYRADQVRMTAGEAYGGLRLAYSREAEPLGTGGALRLALSLLGSDPVLVMNGDSYCAANLGDFHRWHLDRRSEASLLLTEVDDTGRFGRVLVSEDGTIRGFEEKSGRGVPGWINAGVYLLGRARLLEIPDQGAVSLERDLFPGWIGRGVHGYRGPRRFIDIGTEASYAAAEGFFREGGPASASDTVQREDRVDPGKGTRR